MTNCELKNRDFSNRRKFSINIRYFIVLYFTNMFFDAVRNEICKMFYSFYVRQTFVNYIGLTTQASPGLLQVCTQ